MNIKEKDIKSVSEWLNTTVSNLELEYSKEPMEKYLSQAKEMFSTFDEFPKDKKRMLKIKKLLEKGNEVFPIYVEKNDVNSFIMEGRHRIVAFYLLGFNEVMVARASMKKIVKF
jgi:hypothetical protein